MDQIARLGMWLQNAMTKSYLTCFPPAAMLALAGMDQAAAQVVGLGLLCHVLLRVTIYFAYLLPTYSPHIRTSSTCTGTSG